MDTAREHRCDLRERYSPIFEPHHVARPFPPDILPSLLLLLLLLLRCGSSCSAQQQQAQKPKPVLPRVYPSALVTHVVAASSRAPLAATSHWSSHKTQAVGIGWCSSGKGKKKTGCVLSTVYGGKNTKKYGLPRQRIAEPPLPVVRGKINFPVLFFILSG